MTDEEYTKYVELMHILNLDPYPKDELEKINKANRSFIELAIEEEDNRFF